ncbi:MAG: outer membrane lipid asymmetry maintenance protein MlaD [Hyphomonadaceae bacterium]
MKEQTAETIVGALVAIVAGAFLAFAVARAGGAETQGGYPIIARFNRVDGISVGSDVRMSGVKVGAVSAVSLDPNSYMAQITFSVDQKYKVPEDSTAKISSDGLLGGAYVSIEAGGAEAMLKPNGEIAQTQGSVDLLTTLVSAMSNMGSGNGDGAHESSAPNGAQLP